MVDWEGEGKAIPDFKKLEGNQDTNLPQWAQRQKKVFTNWINNKVAQKNMGLKVEELFTDLQDGMVLYHLLEVLSKQSLRVLGKVKPERNKIKKIANMNIVWRYLGTTIKMVGIGPTDIVDGHVTLTLGMIWSLIVFFMGKDLGDAGEDLGTLKKRIMEWVQKRTKHYPDINVTNFTDSFADGKAFMAILNDASPDECPYDPAASPEENLERAFNDAERLYGVGKILDPSDNQCTADEKASITYLAELMKVMPDSAPRKKEKSELVKAQDYSEANKDKLLERLKELCKYKPEENAGAANKVAQFMGDAGMTNIKVLEPGPEERDPSGTGAPFVIAEAAGPPGAPTVLLYATYSVAEDPAGGLDQWASDPFDAVIDAERVTAKGTTQDKGQVVAPLSAIEALLNSAATKSLPVTLKVLVGATPPPTALAGDQPLQVADKLGEFIKANPGHIGSPDHVIVSCPGGSALAPERAAVGVGCRGFASMDIKVSTFTEEEGKDRSCANWAGPVIDPGVALVTMLASVREATSGSLSVKGMKCCPNLEACDKLRGVQFGEHRVRSATGYHPETNMGRDSYNRGSMTLDATIIEQLTLMPAVSITALKYVTMGDGSASGPLSSTFSTSASASVHLALAPQQDAAATIRVFQAHLKSVAPFGAIVEFANVGGHSGWFTPPAVPLVSAITSSRAIAAAKRETVVTACPTFCPLPAAFASSLPASKVITYGINDCKGRSGLANESIKIDDLYDYVKSTINLLHYMANGAPPLEVTNLCTPQGLASLAGFLMRNSMISPIHSFQRLITLKGTTGLFPAPVPCHSILIDWSRFLSLFQMDEFERRNAANNMRAGFNRTNANPLSPPPSVLAPSTSTNLSQTLPSTFQSPEGREPPLKRHSIRNPLERAMSQTSNQSDGISGSLTSSYKGAVTGSTPANAAGPPSSVQGILAEINLLRSNPAAYASKLEALLPFYKGSVFEPPSGAQMTTTEGAEPLKEAISQLQSCAPLPPFTWADGMDRAAGDHVTDLSQSSRTGHTGSDGSKAAQRINRYGQFFQIAGEVITYYETTAAGIVAQLLTSDGERTRQNRKALLASHFKVCGIAMGSHPSVGTVCVVALAGGFGPKPLDHSANVTCDKGVPTPDFERVLQSIPVPQITDEVHKAIADGLEVNLDYAPGQVKLSVIQPTGAAQVMQCQWG
ncbi:unnamed protein product [Chrysoparadoxa australica]